MRKREVDRTERKLKLLRKVVDRADRELIKALGLRFATVRKIGQLKSAKGVPALQKARWAAVLDRARRLGQRTGLDEKFILSLYGLIHKEALKIQGKRKK